MIITALPAIVNIFGRRGNLLSVEESMIDAVLNAAIFAALALCIVGFSAWAHKRLSDLVRGRTSEFSDARLTSPCRSIL